jgi:Bacterial Ig-like domain (group 2)
MSRKWVSLAALFIVGGLLFSLASCGRDQELVSIQVQPTSETFGTSNTPVGMDAGLTVQLRALGTYIHPPVTKDITSQVTWTSNDTQMVTVDSSGVLTATGIACGSSLVSATVKTGKSSGGLSSSGAIVTASMTGNVVCFTGPGGGTGPTITLNVVGGGSGSVTSSPPGLDCTNASSPCVSNDFASGSAIMLTAVPVGTFGGWQGCPSVDGTGLICTISSLTTPLTLTATFN